MEFYLSNETLIRSKFKYLKTNDVINLELPLKYGTKISGHICQGHVDTVGKVLSIKRLINLIYLTLKFKKRTKKFNRKSVNMCKWYFSYNI